MAKVAPPEKNSRVAERRQFLQRSAVAAAALTSSGPVLSEEPASWTKPGGDFTNYGQPDPAHKQLIRWISANPAVPGEGVSWTPLHELEGTITPNGLHFERHHNGVPEIAADDWSLMIHGNVRQPLSFGLETLHRYPLESRISFIECGGNSNTLWYPTPVQAAAGHLHGLVSCAEWTGVRLSTLLNETGLQPGAKWLIADGLDASGVTVSLPLEKCLDDVLVVICQNGEPLRRENGYPARLLVPGWEGNVNVKWLRSLQLAEKPLWSRFDTVSYTDLYKDGLARRMTFTMGVKSVITTPSAGQSLTEQGFYEIRGLAWSGAGRIEAVDISVDGGKSWQSAALQEPVLDKSFTRFKMPWNWQGAPHTIMSRARDSAGREQPTRQQLLDTKGGNVYYHYNAINAWHIATDGSISHVYT
ncbi:MAG: sulfite dehydrogenase [Granulosicoccus sp.]